MNDWCEARKEVVKQIREVMSRSPRYKNVPHKYVTELAIFRSDSGLSLSALGFNLYGLQITPVRISARAFRSSSILRPDHTFENLSRIFPVPYYIIQWGYDQPYDCVILSVFDYGEAVLLKMLDGDLDQYFLRHHSVEP